ncbi:MAG TPA: hypothetical protein VFY96_05965 [Candidatus Binatia bacterium]|nr:hypothetical protein [Candidatus Binatia bacterium]
MTLATLYGYRQPITAAISKNLAALGLEKRAPAAKSLEEILNEPDHDQPEPE